MAKAHTRTKHFTFLIIYQVPDGSTSSASFCEEGISEAVLSFMSFCRGRGITTMPQILSIHVIFSQSDYETYGELYGLPEEFHSLP